MTLKISKLRTKRKRKKHFILEFSSLADLNKDFEAQRVHVHMFLYEQEYFTDCCETVAL